MSLINPPKPKNPPSPPAAPSLSSAIPRPLGLKAIRMMENLTGIHFEPAPSYLFYVEVSGMIVALFTECSGLGGRRTIETFREGGVNDNVHSLPGPVQYGNITLKRGLTASPALWKWFEKGKYDFDVKRVNLSIIQGAPGMNLVGAAASLIGINLGAGYGVVKHWNVEKAYPVSWTLSDLNVNNLETVAVESLELAHEGITLDALFGTPLSMTGGLI